MIAFLMQWKWIIAAFIGLFLFMAGYHLRTLVYEAGELGRANKTIENLQGEVKSQSDSSQIIARKNAELTDKLNELQTQIDETYVQTPAINNPCISALRVGLLNDQRKTADSGRAR